MRAIVFDLDGTLVDTFALSLRGTQHVLRRFVSRPVPDAEVIPLYGIPLRDIMARLADLPTGQAGGQTRYHPEQADAMVAAFEDYYLEHQAALVRPFAGVVETLQGLYDGGYPLAILSNKRKEPGLREMELCGLGRFFRPSTGSGHRSVLFLEDLHVPKPAPEALKQSAEALGVAPADVLHVGDSALDVQCARLAGARSAAALWSGLPATAGWGRDALLAQGPDHLLATAEDLLALCPPLGSA